MSDDPGAVTVILGEIRGGTPGARDRLFDCVYQLLRRMAYKQMRREAAGHTLQPTALVHEAYLRLLEPEDAGWENRRHFFAAAAEAMRRILIERYRRSCAQKHGGQIELGPLRTDVPAVEALENANAAAVDEALTELEDLDPRAGLIVKYRFFLDLTEDETADLLDVSRSTITKEWRKAKAWLKVRLNDSI